MGIVLVQTDDTLESALNFLGDMRLFFGGLADSIRGGVAAIRAPEMAELGSHNFNLLDGRPTLRGAVRPGGPHRTPIGKPKRERERERNKVETRQGNRVEVRDDSCGG